MKKQIKFFLLLTFLTIANITIQSCDFNGAFYEEVSPGIKFVAATTAIGSTATGLAFFKFIKEAGNDDLTKKVLFFGGTFLLTLAGGLGFGLFPKTTFVATFPTAFLAHNFLMRK